MLYKRPITARLLSALLVLVMVVLPSAAPAGAPGSCAMPDDHEQASNADARHCCASRGTETQEHGDPERAPADSGCCPKCMHACCRTAEVVPNMLPIAPARVVINRLAVTDASAADPVTFDAIFHPPRV